MKATALKVGSGLALVAGSGMAAAQEVPTGGIDVSGVVSAVEAAGTDITTVGMAIIGVAAVVFAFRWIKAAFF